MRLHPAFKICLRRAFLRSLGLFEFIYFSAILDKQELKQRGYTTPNELYRYACNFVFQAAKPYLRGATVVIDGSGSPKFRPDLATYLRRHTNGSEDGGSHVSKVKIQGSHANNLLQAAYVVCGEVARSLTDKPRASECRKLVSHREMEVQA